MGGFEPVAKPWAKDVIPDDFEFGILPDDWDQFQILMDNALIRVPALEKAGIKTFMNGPESFTPDNNYILGEAPELKGFFVGAGFNSMGIASCGRRRHGAGRMDRGRRADARPLAGRYPPLRLVQRQRQLAARTRHGDARPALQDAVAASASSRSARPLRRSPLYDRLKAEGRVVRQQDGLGAAQLVRPALARKPASTYSWGRANWFAPSAAEHRATREAVALFDQTSFGKLLVQGRDAEAVLQRLCANDIAGAGRAQRLHRHAQRTRRLRKRPHGGAAGAQTASCSSPAPPQATRDADWIARHMPEDAHATLTDVTSAWAVLVADGPAQPRAATEGDATPTFPMRPFLSAPSARSVSATPRCWPRAAPMSANWAGSSTCRRSSPSRSTRRCSRPAASFGLRDAGYYALESLRHGEGLSRLGAGADARRHTVAGGAGFRGQARQAARLHRPRGAGGRQGQAARRAGWCRSILEDREPLAVGRRGDPARRRAGRRSHIGSLRPHDRRLRWASVM